MLKSYIMKLRALGAVRLSRLTDNTTSPARQEERIRWWSGGNDAEVVHVSLDLDVSGAVSPFDRDGLGPWLTDKKAAEWDVLVSWKLDRISRSAVDTLNLLDWCIAHDKRIVCVDDGIDSATQMGRIWVQLAAIFAEVERNTIKERALASRRKIRSVGRWHGGNVPYGLQAVKKPDGYYLEHDPETVKVIRGMVSDAISGKTIAEITRKLNNDGVPVARKAGKWTSGTVVQILRSKTLLGYVSHNGSTLYDDEGKPLLRSEPLITFTEWEQLQERIHDRARPYRDGRTSSPLSGLVRCLGCDAPMDYRTAQSRDKTKNYYYYACRARCGVKQIRAEDLIEVVADTFMDQKGDQYVQVPRVIPASDNTEELNETRAALEELTGLAGSVRSESAKKRFREQMSALDERLEELENQPQTEAYTVWDTSDRTYREEWESGDWSERRKLLRDAGISIKAKPREYEVLIMQKSPA